MGSKRQARADSSQQQPRVSITNRSPASSSSLSSSSVTTPPVRSYTDDESPDDIIERLRAMAIPETTLQNSQSFIFNDVIDSGAESTSTNQQSSQSGKLAGKATRELCEKPSIKSPDFEELETSASNVQQGISDLRGDLKDLRKVQMDFTRTFKADIQKKLLEFRKKATRVNEHMQNTVHKNNNNFFANELPVREHRFRLTADQVDYKSTKTLSEEQLSELEIHIELIRLNVVQTKRIEHPSQIEDFRDELTAVVKNVTDVKKKYYGLQDSIKHVMEAELEVIQKEERFLKEEPEKIESMIKRCRLLAGTVETLRKLSHIQQESPSSSTVPESSSKRTRKDTLV